MFILASQLKQAPVLSLQTGQVVATAGELIIDPATLSVLAVYCQAAGGRRSNAVIMTRDIRQITGEGLLIDSLEDIEDAGEIIRLKNIIDQKFSLPGTPVANESGQHLGKVEDFTVEAEGYQVNKLYVKQSLLRNLLLNNLVVDRSQIVDVSPKQITVRDATVTEGQLAPQPLPE